MQRLVYTFIVSVAATLGAAEPAEKFFNGKDLTGWSADDMSYWSVKDNAIVGHSDTQVKRNQFLWSDEKVDDFLLTVDVKLTPNTCNAGIQFRSTRKGPVAVGYQADIGRGVWGRLYHEHARGKLDWRDRGEKAVKPGEWNRYEILVVGDRIWTAINGTLAVSIRDTKGEREGLIALQVHSGPPQTVSYRNLKLVHNPPVTLLDMNEAQLNTELIGDKEPQPTRAAGRTKPRGAAESATGTDLSWPQKIAVADPGSQNEAWAKSDFDDADWKTMKLPVHFEEAGLPNYDGVVWFRTAVDLPPGTKGPGKLGLGAIDDMDVTWVNGTRVGGYEAPGHHYTKRNYTIPAGILKPGKNVIAVRVMDHGWPGGISGKAADMKLAVGGTVMKLDTEWRYHAGADLAALNAVTAASSTTSSGNRVRGFANGFALAENDVVVTMGGTNTLKQLDHGYFETLLTRAAGDKPVYFRNMAWQADTVYRQQRPRSFGGHLQHLERVDASVVIMNFGQIESMDGTSHLQAFIEHYGKLLTEVQVRTKKIVLVTPLPFQKSTNPHLPDLTRHNEAVAAYAEAIRQLAAERDCVVVDLSTAPLRKDAMSDGMHLTAAGQHQVAGKLTSALLGADAAKGAGINAVGAFQDGKLEKLRQAIHAKNELWFRHWRPSNWGFLYGNRQHVPSSRDHRDHKKRWFPEEVNGILVLLEKAEDEIHGVGK